MDKMYIIEQERIPNNQPEIEVTYILFIKQSLKSEVNRNPQEMPIIV